METGKGTLMENRMKNVCSLFLSITLPGIMVEIFVYLWSGGMGGGEDVLFLLNGITIIGLLLFYKLKPCSMWVLPLGFALTALVCYVSDTLNDSVNHSEWLPYFYTSIITVYYSIPWTLLSFTIALALTIRKNKGRWREQIRQKGWKAFFFRKATWQDVRVWCFKRKEAFISAGILMAIFLAIAAAAAIGAWSISRKHMVRKGIFQTIDRLSAQEGTCIFKLSEVTGFQWDKVAYIKYPVLEWEISRELGVNDTVGTDLAEGFVFVYQGKVVYKDLVSIMPGQHSRVSLEFAGSYLTVLKEEEAWFEGRKISDTLYWIKPVGPKAGAAP
ncbi:MAG: hypothetical protein HFG61_08240 [Lachnospiraceae bacterium]|nr:hypothetical protein [Lachnospiraceae bacterium]